MTKKALIVCIIAAVLLLITVCACDRPKDNLYNLPVTEEEFESMEVSYTSTTHVTYSSEQELYEAAELVFIGMPTDTFTECETIYYNLQGEQIPEGSTEKCFDYSTLRNVKILEMIKGEYDRDEIKVADMAAVKKSNNGQSRIVGLPTSTAIQKKNVKYIYYVSKANDDNNDYYFAELDDGMINVDGLHANINKSIDKRKVGDIERKFAEKFTKYDRSAELKSEN